MFAYSVGDLVVANWDWVSGQRGKILKREFKQGSEFYLVGLLESDIDVWLLKDSLTFG
jgi:hypothetical protein